MNRILESGPLLRAFLGTALLGLVACGGTESNSESGDRMLDAGLEDVFAVGTFDGEDWETFGEIGQVSFDGEGNLWVMDRQANRFVIIDPNGEFVRTWGEPGEGPGEWRQPAGAAVFRDGTAVVADMGHGTYQIFNSNGEFQGTAPLRDGGITRVGRILADPRGGALFNGGGPTMMSMDWDGEGEPPMPGAGRPIERVTLGDEPRREMFYTAWEAPRGETERQTVAGAMVAMRGEPPIFEPGLHTAVLPTGELAVVDSATWSVKIVDESGSVARTLTRDVAPVEVTESIQEAEMARRIEAIETGQGPRMRIVVDDGDGPQEMPEDQINQMMRRRLENRGFFPVVPVVSSMAAGWDGLLWVERGQTDPTQEGPIDLMRPNGEYVGTIPATGPRIPDAFGPDGLVAYITRDEMEVPMVEVKRLPANLR